MTPTDLRPKARLPRGLIDRSAADIRASERMIARIRRVYERYGFEPVETPLIEYTDALGKFLPDQDRPNEGVFSFLDDDEQWLSLRYDLTAPLARYVAENYDRLPKPYRSYRVGWVFRNEKPGPGRFRQFMQFDADTVGAASPAADAEMCMMAADTLEELGIAARPVRHQGQLAQGARWRDGGDRRQPTSARSWRCCARSTSSTGWASRACSCFSDRGGKDESGDFTKGAGLDARMTGCDSALEDARGRPAGAGPSPRGRSQDRDRAREGRAEELDDASPTLARAAGYGSDRIRIDLPSSAASNTTPARSSRPNSLSRSPTRRASRCASARSAAADAMTGSSAASSARTSRRPASPSASRACRRRCRRSASSSAGEIGGPVVVLVLDRERIGDYQTMVADLRRADIPAEMYLGDSGMKAQMKYADRRNAPLAIIQGGDEKARGVVQIKDLALGKTLAANIAGHEQYARSGPARMRSRGRPGRGGHPPARPRRATPTVKPRR